MSTQENIQNPETWKRGLFILVYAIAYYLAQFVVMAVVLIQFGFKLMTGKQQPVLSKFAQDLSTFLYRVLVYATFVSDEKPYPMETGSSQGSSATTD